jgi:hypothetical protein
MVPALPFLIGQTRLGAIERLDLALLVNRQDQAVRRRVDVQADDVLELGGELRVFGQLEGPDAVGLETVRPPDPLHRAQADPGRLGHCPAGPVGRLAGRLAQGQLDHPLDHRRGQRRLAWRPALVAQQPVDARGHEPRLPAPYRRLGTADLAHDRKRAHAVGAQQHDSRPLNMLLAAVAIRHDRLEPSTIIGGNLDLDALAHPGTPPCSPPSTSSTAR